MSNPWRVLALAGTLGASAASAQRPLDATQIDPEGHRIAFENAYVRVVEVWLATGKVVPMHSHPPRVIVPLGGYRLKARGSNGTTRLSDRRPGEASWEDAAEHAAEVIVGPVHAIEIEPKATRPPAANRKAPDITEVAPEVAWVVFENDQVRVVEIRAPAGSRSAFHFHPARVSVPLTVARFKATRSDGSSFVVDTRPGLILWRDADEHADQVLAGEGHIVMVEIKAAPR